MPGQERYEFGDFALDVVQRQLSRSGVARQPVPHRYVGCARIGDDDVYVLEQRLHRSLLDSERLGCVADAARFDRQHDPDPGEQRDARIRASQLEGFARDASRTQP